ncbi:hypothetical protein ZHAS_00011419 [Anopheles sinensis]|uniref:Uncharacterized protein n=1 Tax=Anopheles sinensis TaxID=74873 RepID=A0A084W0E5_ANOSI|nr:hypothetical protein ZHAS_00011419 [Anopheles sinensis]
MVISFNESESPPPPGAPASIGGRGPENQKHGPSPPPHPDLRKADWLLAQTSARHPTVVTCY